jgi:hypothetical protein
MFNINATYCSIIFANRIESRLFLKCTLQIKLNAITVTEARFLPKHNTKHTAWLQPNEDSSRPHHRRHHIFVCTTCYQSRHRQNLVSIFSVSHEHGSISDGLSVILTLYFCGFTKNLQVNTGILSSKFLRLSPKSVHNFTHLTDSLQNQETINAKIHSLSNRNTTAQRH